jgi:hypothetical protein
MIAKFACKSLRPLAVLGAIAMGAVAVTTLSLRAAVFALVCLVAFWAFDNEPKNRDSHPVVGKVN